MPKKKLRPSLSSVILSITGILVWIGMSKDLGVETSPTLYVFVLLSLIPAIYIISWITPNNNATKSRNRTKRLTSWPIELPQNEHKELEKQELSEKAKKEIDAQLRLENMKARIKKEYEADIERSKLEYELAKDRRQKEKEAEANLMRLANSKSTYDCSSSCADCPREKQDLPCIYDMKHFGVDGKHE